MRNLIKNKQKVYGLNYNGETYATDEQGNYTGEKVVQYTDRYLFYTHISGAKGQSQIEIFGTDIKYDKTFVLTKQEFEKLQITENSVFFVEKPPLYKDDIPLYDYRVERIAETINEVLVAIKKVDD